MMRAARKEPAFVAAVVHRLSGIALALFIPFHFLALALALDGASALDSFLAVTNDPFVRFSEMGLVVALAAHMALGLRVLAIEFLDFRERASFLLAVSAGLVLIVALAFFLNAG